MKRRAFILSARMNLLTPVLLIVLCLSACRNLETQQQPNIVIILTDDQGYQDVGCFGSPDIRTPRLDQMAKEGVRLTNFYATQAVCSASRAALLTGCYPNRIGIHNAFMPGHNGGLDSSEVTIAEMLKEAGYRTAIYGKWHLGDHADFMPLNHGFDDFFGIPYSNDMWPYHPQQGPVFNFGPLPLYDRAEVVDTLEDQTLLTTWITERSVQFIDEHAGQPFFLYVAHPQPHVPLFVSDKFRGHSARGLYGDVIMEIDWSVGQILDALDRHGLADHTLVVFTSDNGPWLSYGDHAGSALPLREGKGTAWEGGHRVPCIIRYPAHIKPGLVSDVPVMGIDLLPTIAAITGTELPPHIIDGKNVIDVLTGQSGVSPHQAYFFFYRVNELHAVRYGHWKMYFPHRYRSLSGRPGGRDGLPVPYDQIDLTEIALYDLDSDESETTNLAGERPEIVQTISALADQMRARLGDRLTDAVGSENRQPGTIQ